MTSEGAFPKFPPTAKNAIEVMELLEDISQKNNSCKHELYKFIVKVLKWRRLMADQLKKIIDQLEQRHCVDRKCQGLLDCKLCLECPLTEHLDNYKEFLACLK